MANPSQMIRIAFPAAFNRIFPYAISPNRHSRFWVQMVTKYAPVRE